MKCQYCDNEVPYNATSCPSCGAQVPLQQPPVQPPPQPSCGQLPPVQPPPQPSCGQQPVNMPDPRMLAARSRTCYVVLAILLGEFGAHNFYAGYTGKACVQLLITVLTAGYCGFISWVWAVVEAVSVKYDARGIPFK